MQSTSAPQTKRICFRPLSLEDRELFLELFTCPQTMRHIGSALTVDQAQTMFRSLVDGHVPAGWRYWVLAARDSGTPLGLGSVEAGPTVAFGLMLRNAARGQGLGREAFDALLEQAVASAGPSRLVVRVDPQHPVMAEWVRKAGFVWMGENAGRGELWHRYGTSAPGELAT